MLPLTTVTSAIPAVPKLRAVGWRRWLPNAITLSRLGFATGFFVMVAIWRVPTVIPSWGHPDWLLLLSALAFVVGAVTDAVDGYLARRWGAVTRFGRIMDPFADKILVIGAFVLLAGPEFASITSSGKIQLTGVWPWMVVILLGRELLVTSIRAVLEREGQDFSATASGKIKMIVQAVAVPTILVLLSTNDAGPGTLVRTVIDSAAWLTVVVTVISGWPYVARGLPAFNADR